MKQSIQLQNTNVEYTLRISMRARGMRLTIYPDGNVVVTTPRRFEQTKIEKFIADKSQWLLRHVERFAKRRARLDGAELTPIRRSRADYLTHKEKAAQIVAQKIVHFNAHYGFKVGRVSIKNQKTRWGSCSKKGNLNFSYRIALLPERLADYLVVHELCHLGEFNHGTGFWKLVEQTIPDYRQRRRELKYL